MNNYEHKKQHDEIRQRVARGAKNQLINYIETLNAKTDAAHRINKILINKNPMIKPEKLKSTMGILNGQIWSLNNTKLYTTSLATTVDRKALRKRNESEEEFEDTVINTYNYNHVFPMRVMITEHAVQRAFERAWWQFKDKDVEEWMYIFALTGSHILNSKKFDVLNKTDKLVVAEGKYLNACVQALYTNDIIVRTFLPPTGYTEDE